MNEKINGYTNHMWNGVTCLELAKFIDRVIKEKLYWDGVKHVHSPGVVSKYDLVSMINDIYELGISITPAKPPQHCYRNLSSEFGGFIGKSLGDQIRELKNFKLNDNN